MNRHMNKKGFTLLEIIVVMVILGVLAAIALPNMFSQVERQRAQEALSVMGSIRSAVESCIATNNNVFVSAECADSTSVGDNDVIGINIPASRVFDYSVVAGNDGNDGSYTITATLTSDNTQTIVMTRDASAAVTCVGAGSRFAGVC